MKCKKAAKEGAGVSGPVALSVVWGSWELRAQGDSFRGLTRS